MRRTCSGVMAVLGAGARGGVVGRSVPVMVEVVLMNLYRGNSGLNAQMDGDCM
jgi:hypothetical protein